MAKSHERFQALIGTVETRYLAVQEPSRKRVSSPHRYCRNKDQECKERPRSRVSSPHRYCRNAPKQFGPLSWLDVFQALIGTVETPTPREMHQFTIAVSSPHRYCRNCIS